MQSTIIYSNALRRACWRASSGVLANMALYPTRDRACSMAEPRVLSSSMTRMSISDLSIKPLSDLRKKTLSRFYGF